MRSFEKSFSELLFGLHQQFFLGLLQENNKKKLPEDSLTQRLEEFPKKKKTTWEIYEQSLEEISEQFSG